MPYRCLILERPTHPPGVEGAPSIASEFPAYGFKPYLASDCERALGILRQWCFDAVVLDAEGFGPAYLQVLRRLQDGARLQQQPLLLLAAAAADEREQILGLEAGATDIVVKPASARLVTTKLRRLIEVAGRDAEGAAHAELRVGPLALHAEYQVASVADAPLKLTGHEFALLHLLASRAGRFVDRATIATALGSEKAALGRSADVHVHRIRKKLRARGAVGLRLDTVYGRGYCLSLEDPSLVPDTGDCFDIVTVR